MKKNINILIVFVFIFLGFIIHVDAANINDLSSGDIVIGNTRFKSGTWVSASRAAKAGSLYTNNTGSTDVNTYLYINPYVIYIYDETIENYKLLTSNEISNLEIEMNIYYENNEPLVNSYESYSLIEGDVLLEANDVFRFYNSLSGEIFLEDENIELDYENETITCPYHYVFDFQVVANNEAENYKGICGIDDFSFVTEEEYNREKIEIESIELVNAEGNPDLLNQSKVDFEHYNSLYYNSSINYVTINEELEVYLPDLAGKSGTYVAFDINISGNSSYRIVDRNFNDKNFSIIGYEDHIRLYLEFDNYYNSPYSFILLDENFGTYEEVYFYISGLSRPTYDLTLKNVKKVDSNIVSNNSLIHSINVTSELYGEDSYQNDIAINTIGELASINYNNINAQWVAVDLFLNDEVDYNYLDINLNSTDTSSYEILEDRIRLYLDYSGISYHISIVDNITNNYLSYNIILNNYGVEDYIDADNGFEGIYHFDTVEEKFVKTKSNSQLYYDILYDEDTSRIYYKEDALSYGIIFKDATSLNKLTLNENNNVIVEDNLDLMLSFTVDDNGEEKTSRYSPTKLELYPELYDYVINNIETYEFDVKKVTIYTFFNRELTETEQAEFDKFDSLVEEGKVEIVDISSSIYE